MEAHDAPAHQGKRRPQQDRGGQDEERTEPPLEGIDESGAAERRHGALIRPSGRGDEATMEDERKHTYAELRGGVADQEVAQAVRPPADEPGAQGHAAHEDREDQGLGVCGVAEEELEVVAPDRLVDQPGEARDGEKGEEDGDGGALHDGCAHRRPSSFARWASAMLSGTLARSAAGSRATSRSLIRRACSRLPVTRPAAIAALM